MVSKAISGLLWETPGKLAIPAKSVRALNETESQSIRKIGEYRRRHFVLISCMSKKRAIRKAGARYSDSGFDYFLC